MSRRIGWIVLLLATTIANVAHADDGDAASERARDGDATPTAIGPTPQPITLSIAPPPPPSPSSTTAAAAPPPASTSPYRFHVGLEAPIIAIAGATLLTALVPTTPAACLPNCPVPNSLAGVDEWAIGNRSQGAGTAADLMLAAVIFAPALANLIATRGREWAWLEDAFITAEATLLATGTSQVLKTGVGRYSPRVYDNSVSVEGRSHHESTRSFWSSHTATATAAATSFAVSYWLRHPHSPWRWAVLGGLEATALGVGLMTVLAGWHFPTDVAAGALFGAASGVAVPMLHTLW